MDAAATDALARELVTNDGYLLEMRSNGKEIRVQMDYKKLYKLNNFTDLPRILMSKIYPQWANDRSKLKRKWTEYTNDRTKIDSLQKLTESKVQNMTRDLTAREKTSEDFKRENDELQSEISLLKTKLSQLKAQHTTRTKEHDEIVNNLKKQNNELTCEVRELKRECETSRMYMQLLNKFIPNQEVFQDALSH